MVTRSVRAYGMLVIAIFFIIAPFLLNLYADLVWFQSIGLQSVFSTMLSAQVLTGVATAIVFALILFGNWYWVLRNRQEEHNSVRELMDSAVPLGIVIISVMAGLSFSYNWDIVLKFIHSTSFAGTDSVFGNNISFYVFSLPFYRAVLGMLLTALIFSFIGAIISYALYAKAYLGNIADFDKVQEFFANMEELKKKIVTHLSVIGGAILLAVAILVWLARYTVLFSSQGAIFGAAYTDIHIALPVMTITSVALVVTAVATLAIPFKNTVRFLTMGIGAVFAIVIIGAVAGLVVQNYVVEPNELAIEKPYIKRNINATLRAYDLESVREMEFTANYNMSFQELQQHDDTLNNIRIWDWRPLQDTYSQLQLFRSYYTFSDVDIDRYRTSSRNGTESTTQVMLAPREMNQDSLSGAADSWVNRHLVYTHGYGAVMSPVNTKTQEGLPQLWLKDLPPQGKHGISLTQPAIYFGENTDDFVITGSSTEEFDYPQSDNNVFTNYSGTAGVELTAFNRLAFAAKEQSLKLLISSAVDSESDILVNRNIHDRVRKVAPFLKYDQDPYAVVANDKLYWIYDAYTTTDKYPYATPTLKKDNNYIRNSVKIVVDAYNGDMQFYTMTDSPLIETYADIFPNLFTDGSEMPSDLKRHIRYPERLFKTQAELYATYHMQDPRVFYNKEDIWKTPEEQYAGDQIPMEPYYVLMDVPGQDIGQNFVLMQPFTPKNRDNMIGWMGAMSDMPHYGNLTVYQFSKQELLYGPSQIEARIDQNTEISQKMTLWSQSGSRVIRGNLLVIPIEDSILYVEPVYLQGTQQGSLPQLKRVIVAYGDRLAMEPTLDQAIANVFNATETTTSSPVPTPGNVTEPPQSGPDLTSEDRQLIQQATKHYQQAQTQLKEGNLSGYSQEMDKVGEILQNLQG